MAISQAGARNVEDTFQGFEDNDFSVDINEKTFRVLLDTLYTNKSRAVIRELATNAYDSHIMVGSATKPFLIQLPNAQAPTFRVRDYGTSLTHEQVMVLYTTVFRSTKERTNAQVGQLGLGSKSPFCYTDAFSVNAYLDGEKRTYLAHMQGCTCGADKRPPEDPEAGVHGYYIDGEGNEQKCRVGVPTIKHLTTEATKEANGLEVSFPVQQMHFEEFAREAAIVARGFDTPPKFEGATVTIAEPKFAHNNWKIYASGQQNRYGTSGMPNAVRQGCVVYPLTENQLSIQTGLSYEYTMVVDVPIGSVEHTANREALSLDDKTKATVLKAFQDALADITTYVESQIEKDSKTLLEAEKAYFHWQRMFNGSRRSMKYKGQELKGYIAWPVNDPRTPKKILDDKEKTVEPWSDRSGHQPGHPNYKAPEHRWSVQMVAGDGNYRQEKPYFVFDSGDRTVPRRRLRIREWKKAKFGAFGPHFWIIVGADAAQQKFVQESLGLPNDHILKVEDLPDPGPPVKSTSTSPPAERSGVYLVHGTSMRRLVSGDKIPDDYIWCKIEKQQASEYIHVQNIGGCTQERIGAELRHFFADTGHELPFLMLTERAVKRLAPKPHMELGAWLKKVVDTHKTKILLRVKAQQIASHIKADAVPGLNVNSQEATELWNLMTQGLGFDFTQLVIGPTMPPPFAVKNGRYVQQLLHSEIEVAQKEGEQYAQQLQKQLPLLFGHADAAFLKGYIQQKGTVTKP